MRRFAVLLLCLMQLTAAASAGDSFMPGEPHRSQLDFRQYFETMNAATGACTVSIQAAIYEDATAELLLARIAEDEAQLAAAGTPGAHTVYVAAKLPAGMQRIGSAIYCTVDDVLDGGYRPWLAEAAFDLQRWQGVGLAGVVFGEPVDTAALAAWYADDTHDDMLSLFPAYFTDAFTDGETRRMAAQTAISLTDYLLRTEQSYAPAAVQAWLTSLGVDRPYADPYAGVLDGWAYTHNQFYALIATSPRGDVFKMNPLRLMTTAAQVRHTLGELSLGTAAILAGVERDAPDMLPILNYYYADPITYEFADGGSVSLTYHSARRITLHRADTILHETAHMLTPCDTGRISRYMDQWKAEAIAEYLTQTYAPLISYSEYIYEHMQDATLDALEDPQEHDFYAAAREIYLQHAPMPASPADVQQKLWNRAEQEAGRITGVELYTVTVTYARAGSAQLDAVNGNELSYIEAEWLASYLVNRHGLSIFIRYCMDSSVSFEDAFGMTYEEAKADWLLSRSMTE